LTILFQDGQAGTLQEINGDFSAWTSHPASPGCTNEVNTDSPHHGTHCAQFTVTADFGYNSAARVTIDAVNVVYARAYFYWDVCGNYYDIIRFYSGATVMFGLAGINATLWNAKYRSGATFVGPANVNGTVFVPNTWGCIEISMEQQTSTQQRLIV
jgi:hypothetical protein